MSKKDLLKEELKRHMALLEYTFYMPETLDDSEKEYDDTEDLLLGALQEQDPVPGGEEDVAVEDPFGAEVDTPPVEEPVETPEEGGEEVISTDVETVDTGMDPFGGEDAMEVEDEVGNEETVEVDVTDIVDKAEETRTEIEGITAKMEELLGNFGELSDQVSGMDQVIDKIENLEKEIEKRNPTPVERLEMRSLDSFPYSIKLSDYWNDKEGYDNGEEEKDYTLTQEDVDDYSETEIKGSFNYDDNDEEY